VTTFSAISDVIGYLVAAATTAFPDPIQVVEGPYIIASELTASSRVWIGFDPTSDTTPAGEASQDFAALNTARSRNEDGSVVCCIESWTGDADNPCATVRKDAFAMFATFEGLLRGATATGGPGDVTLAGKVLWAQIADASFEYESNSSGVIGRITFHVTYQQRLTTG